MTPHFPFRGPLTIYIGHHLWTGASVIKQFPHQVFKSKVLKLATSSSDHDREHGYSNSFHSAEVVHFTHTTCFALTPARDQRAYTQFIRCVGKLTWQSRYIRRTQNMLHDSLPKYRGSVHLTGLATPTPTNSSSSRAAASFRVDWLNKLRPVPI